MHFEAYGATRPQEGRSGNEDAFLSPPPRIEESRPPIQRSHDGNRSGLGGLSLAGAHPAGASTGSAAVRPELPPTQATMKNEHARPVFHGALSP